MRLAVRLARLGGVPGHGLLATALLGLLAIPKGAGASEELPPVGSVERESRAAPSGCVGCDFDARVLLARYSSQQLLDLRQGDVLIESEEPAEGRSIAQTRASSWIESPPELVWTTITDFERWPGFVPLVTETEITRREGPRLWVHQRYRVLFRNLRHTTIYDLARRSGRLSWQLDLDVPHDIAGSQGSWQLVPMEAGAATLIHYRAEVDAGRAVPDFVESMLTRRSLRNLLVELRSEVELRSDLELRSELEIGRQAELRGGALEE